ncbi:DUF397 domain-containing protein [Streptomyces mexicanus]|jgi:hypothetical protein|uniref:DUF397 domain-containing protein n=1 Tax=Streptomyces mexicanus TaxID=178566 RepID=UPI0036A78CA4
MSVQHSKPAVPEAAWIKSSYSTGNGGECVEVAWIKSSYSGAEGGECVEIAAAPAAILVRDSKRPAAARLAFGAQAWSGFMRMAVGG